jgi:ribokinase
MHIVCAGHINWDVRLHVDRLPTPDGEGLIKRRHESGGGSAANVAVGLAELGGASHVLGSVGDDERGAKATRRLEDAGVEPHVRTVGKATTVKYILVDEAGDVALLGTDGANESFGADDLPVATLEGAGALHLTGQDPETAAELARRASPETVVSFDPGRRAADRDYDAVFGHVDLLFVNAREAQALDVDVPIIVTKLGAKGATWAGPDGVVESPGIDVEAVVDTTGAGDAFAAGFFTAWLDDRDPARALRVANACGALAVGEEGPDANLSWERIETMLDR